MYLQTSPNDEPHEKRKTVKDKGRKPIFGHNKAASFFTIPWKTNVKSKKLTNDLVPEGTGSKEDNEKKKEKTEKSKDIDSAVKEPDKPLIHVEKKSWLDIFGKVSTR